MKNVVEMMSYNWKTFTQQTTVNCNGNMPVHDVLPQ